MHPIIERTIDAALLPALAVGAIMTVGMVGDSAWRMASEVPSPKPSAIVLNLPAGSGWSLEARRAGSSSWLELDGHRASEARDGTEMHTVDPPAFQADIMLTVHATFRATILPSADDRTTTAGAQEVHDLDL